MSKTSTEVKARWNKANYDLFSVSLPKGTKEKLKEKCTQQGISVNSMFRKAALDFLDEK